MFKIYNTVYNYAKILINTDRPTDMILSYFIHFYYQKVLFLKKACNSLFFKYEIYQYFNNFLAVKISNSISFS